MAKDPFWSQVADVGECRLWVGPGYGEHGYGMYKHDGRIRLAHRVSWEQDQGAPPLGRLEQSCANKRCVRREHLRPA